MYFRYTVKLGNPDFTESAVVYMYFSPVVLTVVSVATVAGVVLPDCELLSPLLEQPHKTEVSASMAAVTAQIVFSLFYS